MLLYMGKHKFLLTKNCFKSNFLLDMTGNLGKIPANEMKRVA